MLFNSQKNSATIPVTTSERRSPLSEQANSDFVEKPFAMQITEPLRQVMSSDGSQRLQALGALACKISHDLNNLLHIIQNNVDLVCQDPKIDPQNKKALQDIIATSELAAEITDQIVQFGAEQSRDEKPIDLNTIINNFKRLINVAISPHVKVHVNLDPDVPLILGVAVQIQQVLLNLIKNSADAMGQIPGNIEIITGEEKFDSDYLSHSILPEKLPAGRYAFAQISDTGRGLSQERFRQFFQSSNITRSTGHGLGLNIVTEIMAKHHGAIFINTEPQNGTRIRLLFPLAARQVNKVKKIENPMDDWQGSGLVLLVDDDRQIRNIGRQMLERAGFSVLTAENGFQGLRIFQEYLTEIQVVIVNQSMPELEGLALARLLKQINSEVNVILSSGADFKEPTARDHYTPYFIKKPYRYQDLLSVLKSAIYKV